MRIRAEDLLKEDAIKPNILDAVRDLERKVARMQRAKKIEANVGDKLAAHNVLSPERNLVTVAQEGGDFETITEALISIEDASIINPYTILVYPGIYDERVVMKEYVALVGLDRDVCIIQSSDYQDLVMMASNSSLNEIQVINNRANGLSAVFASSISNYFLDSCIVRINTNSNLSCDGLKVAGSTDFKALNTRFYAKNIKALGNARPVAIYAIDSSSDEAEFDNCLLEIEDGTTSSGSGFLLDSTAYVAKARIMDSRIIVPNTVANQDGIYARSVIGLNSWLELISSTVEHAGTSGGGADLVAAGVGATIYVRGVRYSTWNIPGFPPLVGQIIPLAGDRPRLECISDGTDLGITAGAGAWQNDPTGVVTIDLPCESDLKVDVTILWLSDTVRAQSFRAQIDLDGVLQSGLGYAGEPVTNHRMVYSLTMCFADVAAGNHTLSLQVGRNNVADVVTVDARKITVMSDPWP